MELRQKDGLLCPHFAEVCFSKKQRNDDTHSESNRDTGESQPGDLEIREYDDDANHLRDEPSGTDQFLNLELHADGTMVGGTRFGDVAVFDAAERKEVARISMAVNPVDETDQRLFGDQFGDSPVPVGILVHPDGKTAFVANTNADVITVIDLGSMEIQGRMVAGEEPDGLGYTPLTVGPVPAAGESAGE